MNSSRSCNFNNSLESLKKEIERIENIRIDDELRQQYQQIFINAIKAFRHEMKTNMKLQLKNLEEERIDSIDTTAEILLNDVTDMLKGLQYTSDGFANDYEKIMSAQQDYQRKCDENPAYLNFAKAIGKIFIAAALNLVVFAVLLTALCCATPMMFMFACMGADAISACVELAAIIMKASFEAISYALFDDDFASHLTFNTPFYSSANNVMKNGLLFFSERDTKPLIIHSPGVKVSPVNNDHYNDGSVNAFYSRL